MMHYIRSAWNKGALCSGEKRTRFHAHLLPVMRGIKGGQLVLTLEILGHIIHRVESP